MLCIISPAKSLATNIGLQLPHAFSTPAFLDATDELAGCLKKNLTTADYKKLMNVSDAIASRTHSEYQAYQPQSSSKTSDSAFTPSGLLFDGPAYKGLDLASLSPSSVAACQKHVRFLSGLYGFLRPCDLIQNHRLEMGTKGLTIPGLPKNATLYEYWKTSLIDNITSSIGDYGILLNCASEEYFKVIDKESLQRKNNTIRIITCAFTDKGKVVSVYAKRARGLMSRYVSCSPTVQSVLDDQDKGKIKGSLYHDRMIAALEKFNYEGYKYMRSTASSSSSSGRDGDITLHFNRESIPTKKDYVNESGSARAPVQPSTKVGSKRKAAVVSIDNHGDDSDKNAKTKSVTQIKKKK